MLFTTGAGYGFRQDRVNFIQHLALIGAFGEYLLVDAGFTGAFNQIADLKVVFEFEFFFCHFDSYNRFRLMWVPYTTCSPYYLFSSTFLLFI